jgi:hypothetical protein
MWETSNYFTKGVEGVGFGPINLVSGFKSCTVFNVSDITS